MITCLKFDRVYATFPVIFIIHHSLLKMTDISSVLQGGYNNPLSRKWHSERALRKSSLMYPIFITDKPNAEEEISSMPGQKR